MDLKETSPIPDAALPFDAFRAHLRLGSGFADSTTEEATLAQFLRAAIASVEGRVSRVLFERSFKLRLRQWRNGTAERLPVAPVTSLDAVGLVSADGVATMLAPGRVVLARDAARPCLIARSVTLPAIPTGGHVEITFTAGFGPAWEDIPADLRQAVLLLAAQYYEARDSGGDADMAFGIAALLERWRDIRIGGRA